MSNSVIVMVAQIISKKKEKKTNFTCTNNEKAIYIVPWYPFESPKNAIDFTCCMVHLLRIVVAFFYYYYSSSIQWNNNWFIAEAGRGNSVCQFIFDFVCYYMYIYFVCCLGQRTRSNLNVCTVWVWCVEVRSSSLLFFFFSVGK